MGASTQHCTSCDRTFSPGGVFFAFRTTVQGEQTDTAAGGGGEEDPAELLARMEAEGDWDRYAEDVHWELRGTLCSPCKERLKMLLRRFGAPVQHEE